LGGDQLIKHQEIVIGIMSKIYQETGFPYAEGPSWGKWPVHHARDSLQGGGTWAILRIVGAKLTAGSSCAFGKGHGIASHHLRNAS
jgi:hypothetical protein